MKVWFQENLRMIVSIVIVVVIALGIYSYSKRNQVSTNPSETSISQQGEGKISVVGGDNTAQNEQAAEGQPSEQQEQPQNQPATAQPAPSATPTPTTQVAGPSKETDNSFIETAAQGDGSTKLARRALANYLEKNPDTNLTAAHKIFIEDLLRRQVADGHLKIGDTREFSKDSIAKAIEKSKTLNDRQLKNLQKFAQRVPGLGT